VPCKPKTRVVVVVDVVVVVVADEDSAAESQVRYWTTAKRYTELGWIPQGILPQVSSLA